jgi:hypothetical protein
MEEEVADATPDDMRFESGLREGFQRDDSFGE